MRALLGDDLCYVRFEDFMAIIFVCQRLYGTVQVMLTSVGNQMHLLRLLCRRRKKNIGLDQAHHQDPCSIKVVYGVIYSTRTSFGHERHVLHIIALIP